MFDVIDAGGGRFIKAWRHGVRFEDKAIAQLQNVAQMPFVRPYVAAMPDTHWGMGATVGSVIPSVGAIMPAAVGVDIGCGMIAVRTNHTRKDIEPAAEFFFNRISAAVPTGRTNNGREGDRGAWGTVPDDIHRIWMREFVWTQDLTPVKGTSVFIQHPQALSKNAEKHLGTLGTGNHFIEVSVDEKDRVWVVIHSGSRGFGNRIGTYFTNLAKERCEDWFVHLPDRDLAYFPQGSPEYNDYLKALHLAQRYAWRNREIMMERVLDAIQAAPVVPTVDPSLVHVHHNYMAEETHFGEQVLLTRKGAVKAAEGDLVIIPGSMGARTYIARGLGNPNSFQSCSHGAGRAMSRTQAKNTFSIEDHVRATQGVECHKGVGVIDETPGAYKDIEAVMAAQSDLVEPLIRLRQIICVKGLGE